MKKILSLAIIFCIFTSFFGCYDVNDDYSSFGSVTTATSTATTTQGPKLPPPEVKPYSVKEVNGQWYLIIDDMEYYYDYATYYDGPQEINHAVAWRSMEQIKNHFFEGGMDAVYLTLIANYFPKDNIGIKIFNPHELYDAIVPELPGYKVLNLLWDPSTNIFEWQILDSALNFELCFRHIPPEIYNKYFESMRNMYNSSNYEYKVLQKKSKTIEVFSKGDKWSFWGNDNGQYFYVAFDSTPDWCSEEVQTLVTDEWIMGFGLKKCE